MKESTTYQEIIEEGIQQGREQGREEGRAEARQDDLILIGSKRFGRDPDERMLSRIRAIHDPSRLEELLLQILDAEDWNDLLADQ